MHTWRVACAIAGALLLIGGAVLCLGRRANPTAKDLAASGRSVLATITSVMRVDSDNNTFSYEYRVDGIKHYGSTGLPTDDVFQPNVGRQVAIVYLPANPDVSDYRPLRHLGGNRSPNAGFVLIGAGLALLIVMPVAGLIGRKVP